MKRIVIRFKMLWRVLTEKQVVLLTESHKHGTHQYNSGIMWDTRSYKDVTKILSNEWNHLMTLHSEGKFEKKLETISENACHCNQCTLSECRANRIRCAKFRNYHTGIADGFQLGYKDVINECREQILEQCKEWLCIHFRNIANTDCCTNREHPTNIESVVPRTMKEMLADFETDMKKLWEEEK